MSVENEDILDDGLPVIYVQRYTTAKRAYRVFRTEVDNPDSYQKTDQDVWYALPAHLLDQVDEELDDDQPDRVVAFIFTVDQMPVYISKVETEKPGQEDNDPLVLVSWDAQAKRYHSEAIFNDDTDMEGVQSSSLQAVIDTLIERLDARDDNANDSTRE